LFNRTLNLMWFRKFFRSNAIRDLGKTPQMWTWPANFHPRNCKCNRERKSWLMRYRFANSRKLSHISVTNIALDWNSERIDDDIVPISLLTSFSVSYFILNPADKIKFCNFWICQSRFYNFSHQLFSSNTFANVFQNIFTWHKYVANLLCALLDCNFLLYLIPCFPTKNGWVIFTDNNESFWKKRCLFPNTLSEPFKNGFNNIFYKNNLLF